MKRVLLSATALALVGQFFQTSEAVASGFLVREHSAEGLATAYGGDGSRADEAATVFNNPAGMMHLSGDEVEVGSAVIFPSIHFSGSATIAGVAPLPGDNGGNGGRIQSIPHLYGAWTINDRLKVGIAVTVPFGLVTDYGTTWIGRYLAMKTLALSADINPNIAYRVNNWLSIAGGVSAQYLKLESSVAIPQFLILSAPAAPDATFYFKGDDWAWGYNFGLLAEVDPSTRIGLTYRSEVDHKPAGTEAFQAANPVLGLANSKATAHGANLPASIGASVTHDYASNWSVSTDVQFTQWSSLQTVLITSSNIPVSFEEKFKDTWMIAVGATYRADDHLTWRGGIAWDQTPVTDRYRTVAIPDADRVMVGLGLGYRWDDSNNIDFGVSHYFSTEHASMNNSLNNRDPLTQAIKLQGTFNNHLDYVAISFRHKL
jgi:long-chain fatty acid transport protein